jgi:type II secretory pathway pseudopilin PulG
MTARGFTLIELLIAAAVVIAISGALAALVAPLDTVIDRASANADIDAGMRTTIQQVAADLRQAGGGAAIALPDTPLAKVVPPVVPLRDLDSDEVAVPAAAIRIRFVPHLAAQGVLAADATAGETWIQLDTTARCATGPPSCGFLAGRPVVLYSSSAAHLTAIATTAPGAVLLASPLVAAFPQGAVLSELVTVTYGTRPAADGSQRLVRISSGGAEQPMLDHVVEFAAMTDADDPLAAAQLALTLRVQAPSPHFRGPAGFLFRQAGSATHARRWIPDVELRMVVALRNREGGW